MDPRNGMDAVAKGNIQTPDHPARSPSAIPLSYPGS